MEGSFEKSGVRRVQARLNWVDVSMSTLWKSEEQHEDGKVEGLFTKVSSYRGGLDAKVLHKASWMRCMSPRIRYPLTWSNHRTFIASSTRMDVGLVMLLHPLGYPKFKSEISLHLKEDAYMLAA